MNVWTNESFKSQDAKLLPCNVPQTYDESRKKVEGNVGYSFPFPTKKIHWNYLSVNRMWLTYASEQSNMRSLEVRRQPDGQTGIYIHMFSCTRVTWVPCQHPLITVVQWWCILSTRGDSRMLYKQAAFLSQVNEEERHLSRAVLHVLWALEWMWSRLSSSAIICMYQRPENKSSPSTELTRWWTWELQARTLDLLYSAVVVTNRKWRIRL